MRICRILRGNAASGARTKGGERTQLSVFRGGGPRRLSETLPCQHLAFRHASTCQGARWRITEAPDGCGANLRHQAFTQGLLGPR
eukprot:7663772-Pyramimonas_sp.AAC.1